MSAFDDLVKMFKKEKRSGSDYTGTVTRVEGNTAYVQLTGSDIADTPVAMSISAKPGDKVRVRVSNGKAHLTGNDTLPPSNDQEEVSKRMKSDMSNRNKNIDIAFGKIAFKGNTLVVDSDNFKLDEQGNATFSGNLSGAGGTFSGDLNAAGGTFSGKLQAVDGEFLGTLTFDWAEDTALHAKIEVGSGQTSPISIYGVNVDEVTDIQTGTVSVGANEGRSWAQMDPYDGFQWSSDRRIKDDIKPIDDPDMVLKLNPVTYRFKADEKKKTHYGFIAQEIEEIMPDVVTENKDGFLGLTYTEFIAPAIAMIQKQEKRIAALEAEILALKEEIGK